MSQARAEVAKARQPWVKALVQLTLPSTEKVAERCEELRATADATQKARFITILASMVVLSVLLLLGLGHKDEPAWRDNVVVLGVMVVALTVLLLRQFSVDPIVEEVRDLELEQQFQDPNNEPEDKAYRLFKRHERELRKYYNLTLSQSRWMMAVGMACVALGVVVVAVAGYYVKNANDKMVAGIVAGLGAVGTILTNYVAGIYLKMHAATAQAVNEFHTRLVSTHHLHVANYLVSKIQDEDARAVAIDKIVTELAKH